MKKNKNFNHDEYGYSVEEEARRKITGPRIFLFIAFLALMLLLLAYPFRDKINFTGWTVFGETKHEGFNVSTELTVSPIYLSGDYSKISLFGLNGKNIQINGKDFQLNEGSNDLILEDFSGKLRIDKDLVYLVEGKAAKVQLNELKISDDRRTRIYFSENSSYSALEVDSNVYLNEIKEVSSGRIYLGENTFVLKENYLELENFFGKIKIKDKKLFATGIVSSLVFETDFGEIKAEYEKPEPLNNTLA